MKVTIVAGARPNFMKIAPIIDAIEEQKQKGQNIQYRLVHTGQHFDNKMSGSFFEQLGIPSPDINLECGGGSQAEQTASIMINFEKDLIKNPTDLVIVVGDVTSTMACAIVAQKCHTKVAHIEGGIRSDDWTMPEEINRLVTDSITNYFFTTSEIANQNLLSSGISNESIFFVGNTMIDTLLKHSGRFSPPPFYESLQLKEKNYLVLTLHRPSNVDNPENLVKILDNIVSSSRNSKIVFPVHPRTLNVIKSVNYSNPQLHFCEPLSYLHFNFLVKGAKAVITDSGGITEETTVLGVPCMTLRESTERPETITIGTNELLGLDPEALKNALDSLFNSEWKKGGIPQLWDGKAAQRIVLKIIDLLSK